MSDFLKHLSETCAQHELERNLRGKTLQPCKACDGKGYSQAGYSDYDAHGSYWVDSVPCRSCGGAAMVEVACSPELEETAIKAAIERMRARLKELRKQPR